MNDDIEEARPRAAVVTGASSGIGQAIARRLAAEGWTVGLVARRRERLEELQREIAKSGGTAHVHAGDLRDAGFAAEVIDAFVARAGRLDLLVNNAGAPTPVQAQAEWSEVPDAEFDRAFALNVRAAYRLSFRALPHLRASRGSIVNIGSAGVARNLPIDLVYLSSKGAAEVMSRGMAKLWAPLGVRVNVVSPGMVPTEILEVAGFSARDVPAQLAEARARFQPLPYEGKAEDIARAVAYLASDAAAFITGAVLQVDGGMALGA